MFLSSKAPTLSGAQVGSFNSLSATSLTLSGNALVAGGVVAGGTGAFSGLTVSGLVSTSNLFTSNATVVGDVTCGGKLHGDGSLLTNLPSSGATASAGAAFIDASSNALIVTTGDANWTWTTSGSVNTWSDPGYPCDGKTFGNNAGCIVMDSSAALNIIAVNGDIVISPAYTHITSIYDATFYATYAQGYAVNVFNCTYSRSGTVGHYTYTPVINAVNASATFKNLYYVATFGVSSDSRLKTDVSGIDFGSLEVIKQLRPVTYRWNDVHNGLFNTQKDASGNVTSVSDTEKYPGFIAQEVEVVLPIAVGTMDVDGNTYKTLKPLNIIPYLVKAVQELSDKVDTLQAQLNAHF